MKKVLAIRTPEGQYLEFDTLRAVLDDGNDVVVDLSDAIFAQVIAVPEGTRSTPLRADNGRRTIVIDGVGGIDSQESVHGAGPKER